MGQEICNPHRVVHVGLATWHRLDALCIRDKVSSKSSSSRCHTGFQYTPVASIAICFTSHPVSQAFSSSNEHVVVSKVFTSLCTGSLTQRMLRHHRVLMDIQSRTSSIQYFHSLILLIDRMTLGGIPYQLNLLNALGASYLQTKPWRQLTVLDRMPGSTHSRA